MYGQVLFILVFLVMTGLFSIVTGGLFDIGGKLSFLIGYLVWRVAAGCMYDNVSTYTADARTGVLEKQWMTPTHPGHIILARSTNLFILYTLRVMVMAIIISLILRLPLFAPLSLDAILFSAFIYTLTIIGAFGLAFAVTGLQILYKGFAGVMFPLANLLLFLTGAMIPVDSIPVMTALSKLLPLSSGISILRLVLVERLPVEQILANPDFFLLIINTTVYLAIGLLTFNYCVRAAKRDGNLGHY